MADYRIYLLHDYERVTSGANATCANDQDACFQAQRTLDGSGYNQAEVWIGTKYVGSVLAHQPNLSSWNLPGCL